MFNPAIGPEPVRCVPPSSGGTCRIALLLFLFLNCVYLLTSTGRARTIDEIDPVVQSESLLLRHSTAIPQAVHSGIYFGKIDRHGLPRSAWPSGHALMVLPWSAAGHAVVRWFRVPDEVADLAVSTVTCWSNATYAALSATLAFLILFRTGGSPRNSAVCSLALAFCTPLFVYSGWLYSEPASAFLFLGAALLLFASGSEPSIANTVMAGILLAFSIHVRPANMVTVTVFIVAAMLLRREERFAPRTALVLIALAAVSGLCYLARNHYYFGNPFDFGVPPTAENGKDLESWHNPVLRGIFGFLFSPGKSAFLFCPPALLGIAGLPALWKRNRALGALVALTPTANLLLYSFRTQWEGSYCYGPRYLLPSLLLLCLPMGELFRRPSAWVRPAFYALAAAGFLVQGIGLSVNILEDMLRHRYYDAHWDYQMSYFPIPGQLELIWKYLHGAPAVIGYGWDRWFVLLRAAGVSSSLTNTFLALFATGALLFGTLAMRAVRAKS